MSETVLGQQAVVFTRSELQRLVWEIPIERLAAQYGISGRGLSKICGRLSIRCPPRGYWAKPAAVRAEIRPAIRPDEKGAQVTVKIVATRPRPTAQIAPINIEVQSILRNPHPIVFGWMEKRRIASERYSGELRPWMTRVPAPRVGPSERRRLCILDALFKALEIQAAVIDEDGGGCTLSGEHIGFSLYEKQRVVGPAKDGRTKYDYEATGLLSFVIRNLPTGLQSNWLESRQRPMETLLPRIVGTLVEGAQRLAAARLKRQEIAEFAAAQRLQERDAERRRELDERRWRSVVDFAKRSDECDSVKRALRRLKTGTSNNPAVHELIEWIDEKIQTLETNSRDPESLMVMLASFRR